jgi:cAMP-dependent protein kinase regulator
MTFEDIRNKYFNDIPDVQNEIRHADIDYQKSVKPIRKTNRRKDRKKKIITNSFETVEDADVDFTASSTEKSSVELARIKELVNSNFMIAKLTQVQKELLYKVMLACEVKRDAIIINEGDIGDEMFIIDFGEYDVYKNDENKKQVLVFTYTSGAFGELSLIYGEPRAATVKAKTDGKLWRIGRKVFKAIMSDHHKLDSPFSYLKSVPIFSDCTSYQIQRVSEYSVELVLTSGDVVIEYGKNSQYDLYIIVSGSVQLEFSSGDISQRGVNTFFGAFELGQGMKCVKRVTCKCEVKMIAIPKTAIVNVIGNDVLLLLQSTVTRDKDNFNLIAKSNIFIKNESKKINSNDYLSN